MELSLGKLLQMMRQRIWWILLCTAIGGVLAFSYTKIFVAPTYVSSVKMMVTKNNEIQANDATDIVYAQRIVKTYMALLDDHTFYSQVAANSGLDYTAGQLQGMFSFSIIDETEVFQVSVEAHSSKDTKIIANAASKIIPKQIQNVYTEATVKQTSQAQDGRRVGPSLIRNTVFGGIVGAVAVFLIIFLKEMLDVRIKTEEDLVEHYDIPLLGSIPDFSPSSSKKTRR